MSEQQLSQEQQEQEALVAQWLLATPGFFERHTELLTQIQLKSPHGDKAISLQEKQMALLRSQNKDLNQRLSAMLNFGAQNDKTQNLMVTWIADLLAANSRDTALNIVTQGLNSIFDLGQAVFIPASELSEEMVEQVRAKPFCGNLLTAPEIFQEKITIQSGSLAALLLNSPHQNIGVLLLVSPHIDRFTSDMGVVYLVQLANLAGSALGRFEV